jgi:hypothetical protein
MIRAQPSCIRVSETTEQILPELRSLSYCRVPNHAHPDVRIICQWCVVDHLIFALNHVQRISCCVKVQGGRRA